MLSIIICSRKIKISKELSVNIAETIDFDYELVVIDNSENRYSIFEAFNIGIQRSIGDYLCFIHDDILFHTKGWGNVITSIFESDDKIGLIGVAGAKVKTKMPSAWWDCPENQKVINIIQHFPNKEKEMWNLGFNGNSIQEVAVIDGVFMAARNVKSISFSAYLRGFHNYDLNFSFEYLKHNYKIVVTKDILLEHFSLGTLNAEWADSTYKVHNIYKNVLRLALKKGEKKNEIKNAEMFLKFCDDHKRTKIAILVWIKLFKLNPITRYHYQFWKKIIKSNLC